MMAKRQFLMAFPVLRYCILLLLFMGGFMPKSVAQIWSENFNSYGDATVNAPPKWTSYATDCDDAGINLGPGASQWGVWAGVFTCNDIEGAPCCAPFGGGGNDNAWTSEIINIANYCNISINLDAASVGTFECSPIGPLFACQGNPNDDNGHDQIVGQYSINSGPWTQFMYICGSGNGNFSVTGLNGNTLQIKVYASNKSNGEFYYFDNVVVNGTTAPTPSFTPIGPLCENASPVVLPTTSNQGITGTWNPSSINPAGQGGNSIMATFTPSVGQCATSTTMMVTINSAITPMPNPIGPFCTTDPASNLLTNIGGINGTWSGTGVSANTFNPMVAGAGNFNLTFTPNVGQCANPAVLPVSVSVAATPNLGSAIICQTDPAYNLTLLQDPMYPAGTWSGPGVVGNNFNPMGQSGGVILTFTSSTNCVQPANTSITVNTPTTPAITGIPASICENATAIALPTPQGGFAGNWSGTGVSGNNFDPTGLSGSVTLTFTPNAGQCASPATTSINVTTPTTPAITGIPASICENATAIALPTPQGGFAGNWSGMGVSGNSFNPTGLSGSVTLTFTPNAGQCANPANTSINVTAPTTPAITGIPASICENATAIALPTPQGGFAGNWSGMGVSGNSFNPTGLSGSVTLTFTPNAGQCASPATTSINVTAPTTPAITGVPASICENATAIALPTPQGGFAGNWSGTGVSGNNFNPTGLSGSVTLTFTPNAGQCANPANTSINVTAPTTPAITGVPASICENATAIALPTPQGGFAGNWSGMGVSGNSFNPTGLSGNVTLTFTPNAGQCANPANTSINVTAPTTPAITGVPASICENATAIALPTPQGGFAGNWSGTGVSGNNFSPTGLSGSVTLTFTPNAGQCANPANTSINVTAPTTPAITGVPASICENATAIALPTPQGGFAGNWSGTGVSGNNFDPTGLSGSVTLTFTPNAGQCANPATTNINITAPTTPAIIGIPASICESAPPIFLATSQGGFNGTWSGTGVTGNNFNPSGLSGSITLTFTPNAGQCANLATTNITVNQPSTPILGSANLCENNGLYDLTLLADPNFPTGTWIGPGVNGNNFNPFGQNGNVVLTFSPSANCAVPNTTTITVTPGIGFTGLSEVCDLTTQTYTVSFTITGGTAPFTVNGVTLPGNTFISAPIPSGTSYFFDIDDVNGCGPVSVSGSQNCSCTTDAGTMNFANPPLKLCYNHFQFSVPFNQDEVLDADDLLQFVLHDGPNVTTSNILSISNSAVFNIPAGLVLGQTYYVSAVAGNNDGTGNVDFNEPCFSYSQAIPIVFYIPTVQLGNDVTICASDCYDIPVQFSGVAPFYIEWNIYYNNILVGNSSSSNLPANSTVQFCPANFNITSGVVRIEITALEDGNNCGVSLSAPDINLTVGNGVVNNLSPTLCPGESLVVKGTTYNQANPSGTEFFPGGSASGCDSTVNVNLAFYPLANFTLAQSFCGNGSVTVNGTVYNQSHPSGTEVLQNASINGCDSTVFVNLTFKQPSITNITQTLCTSGSMTVNGTVYDASNPTGTEVIVGGAANGCDSTINVNLSFNSVVNSNISPTLCPNGSVTVNGTVYNTANPSGMETMPGASYLGCDSIATVSLSFFPPAFGNFTQTLCTGGSVTVGGTVFDGSNPSGTVVIPNGSVNGCDSTINVSISFSSVVTSNINQSLCPNGSITVNGTVYNATNPSGTETMPGASYLGCDSVAMVSLTFYPPATGSFSQTICSDANITVGGTVFDQNNPSGSVVFPNASVNGCDSTVMVNLQFFPPAIGIFSATFCPGQSTNIGGTVFNQANPSGTVIIPNGSVNGCDSTVTVSLQFSTTVQGTYSTTLCPGKSITIGGTVFNQANPSGMVTFPNGSVNGCDSTVTVSIQFFPPAIGIFNQTFCPGGSITIGGTVFNQANPSGSVVIPNGSINGCDSTINVNIQFYPPAQGSYSATLCPGASATVGGTVFNQANPSGTVTIPNGSFHGCDSTIMVSLSFFQAASSTIDDQFCIGGSITVNGTVYDEQNPTGTEILQNASVNGCDSTVFINLTFGTSVIVTIDPTLCPDEVVVVNGQTYSATNPMGSVTFPNGSYLGCDSIVNVNLSFYPAAVGNVTEILQMGGSIVVNGTIYNEQNPSGTEVFTDASYYGCDSTVVVNLVFEGLDAVGIVEVVSPLCHFGGDGVITLTGIQGGVPPYVVALNGGSSAPVVNFPVVFDGLTFGFHTLTIIDAMGTITTQEIFMPDAPLIQLSMDSPYNVALGNSVQLGASSSSQITTWTWSPPDYLDCTNCPNPVSTPLDDIVYTISVMDANGCTAEGQLAVFVEKVVQVYVPSAFSPNNDGINDELTIFAGPQVEKIKSFKIFSRWGELVHELYNFDPNDLQLGWKGDFKGEELDPAVFVWYAEIVFKDGQTQLFKGGVNLIR